MRALIFHFLFCSLLFWDNYNYQQSKLKTFYKRAPAPSWVKYIQRSLKKKNYLIPKEHQSLLLALTTGKKTALRRTSFYQVLQKAGMLHLLTPSGLHLSSIIILIFILFRKKKLRCLLLLGISPFLFAQNGFYAAKRILALKVLNLTGVPIKIAFYLIFSTAFLIKPDLSVLLSFLFVGTLLLNPYRTFLSQIFFIALSQIITCFYFEQSYYIYSIFINTIGSLYISLVFGWVVLTVLFPSLYLWSTKYLIYIFYVITYWIEGSPKLF